jgi:hypothetical protein
VSDYTVDVHTGCWVWRRTRSKAGYGQMYIDGKMVYAHREYYESYVADIPPGLVIDHLCRNRACCNPDHLEPVTSVGRPASAVTCSLKTTSMSRPTANASAGSATASERESGSSGSRQPSGPSVHVRR